jgi:hypothetical protein
LLIVLLVSIVAWEHGKIAAAISELQTAAKGPLRGLSFGRIAAPQLFLGRSDIGADVPETEVAALDAVNLIVVVLIRLRVGVIRTADMLAVDGSAHRLRDVRIVILRTGKQFLLLGVAAETRIAGSGFHFIEPVQRPT